jgi:hypothetical protein
MGGTEILSPLFDIFKGIKPDDMLRSIYLLTDGAVFNAEEVVKIIRKNNKKC